MIPLKDENPTRCFPWMTLLLIAVNLAVFAYEWTLSPEMLSDLILSYGFTPVDFLADPWSPTALLTVVTSMFLHAGPVHVGGNLLYLWIFGNNIEDRLGPWRYLGFYLLCGTLALAAQTAMGPDVDIPTIGASGAVAGVLGAYILLYPRASVVTVIPLIIFFEVARLPAYLVIGFWFLLQLASGLASIGPEVAQAGGVAWFAHIGGFVAGVALVLPLIRVGRWGRARR